MVYQFYVVEITQDANGEIAHNVTWHWDEDADKAQVKAEAKFHEVFADEGNFTGMMHSAILFSIEGFPIRHEVYKHTPVTPVEEPTEEEPIAE